MKALLVVAVGAAMAVGIAGTVVPVLPGLLLVWGAALVYGLASGFGWSGWTAMAVISALGAAGLVASVRLPQRSAAATGIGRSGQLVGLALAVAGFFLVPVVGAPLGFAAGVLLASWWRAREWGAAWASTRVTLKALLAASGVQLVCGVGMALTWGLWVVVG